MKTRRSAAAALLIVICCHTLPVGLRAQTPPQFIDIRPLTNREIRLQLSTTAGRGYRIDATTNPEFWTPFITLTGATTSLSLTDSAAPYLSSRFYRAEQLGASNLVTGDYLNTADGEVLIHPLYHASTLLLWNGKAIYADPDDDAAYEITYQGKPKAGLILVTHSHGDHFSSTKIDALRTNNTIIVVPQAVYTSLSTAQRTNAIVLGYGASTNIMGLNVQAVHAYNANHMLGSANGYVITIGGRRIYFSGDTGDVPEIRALPNIDVAFLCMNTPFTMSPTEATNCVRGFRPKVVYPYHYRNSGNITTNAAYFKQILGTGAGIEVRLRKWY